MTLDGALGGTLRALPGLFAVGETLYMALYEGRSTQDLNKLSSVHMTRTEWRRSWPAWLRGTFIGFPFGTIPAGGSEIPTFLSYATERKLSPNKHEFGTTGAIEGVAGPEAANNAAVTATLVPLLTLGIPTSVTAAILLSALQNYGIQAGPQLFTTSSTRARILFILAKSASSAFFAASCGVSFSPRAMAAAMPEARLRKMSVQPSLTRSTSALPPETTVLKLSIRCCCQPGCRLAAQAGSVGPLLRTSTDEGVRWKT